MPGLRSALLLLLLCEPLKGKNQICLVFCFVSSAQHWTVWHITIGSILWRVEPSKVRVLRSHSIFPSPLLPGSGTSEFDSPSPIFWPSLESWGGRWEEEGETVMALQRVRKPPCCLAAGTTGMVLAGAACWAEITMETRLGEGHWQWLRAGGGGTDRDL